MVVTELIHIPDQELEWAFARSGGPGGQNVNKVASKAELRWKLAENTSVPEAVRQRLKAQQRRRLTADGDLLVTSQKFRDQPRNREDCLEKLRALVVQALAVPKPRRATKPTRGSKERRLAEKRHRASTKSGRRDGGAD